MSLLKIPVLLISSVLVWKAFTPPRLPPSPPAEKVQAQPGGIEQFVGYFVPYQAYIYKVQFCFGSLCEIAWIIACNSWQWAHLHPFFSTLKEHGDPTTPVGITPQFAIGTSLIIAGAVLRIVCYRVLGKQFTFVLQLRDKHQLITAGPYAYVRHPSYTGLFSLYAGCALVLFGDGSWFREGSWLNSSVGVAWVSIWVLMRTVETINILVRTVSEDRFLKDRFGDQWERWAAKTQYRIVPFIF
ncbi:hypothetical protein BV25DRAFT_1835936 [Artomyces pyxidatus]|uniref:Uncharacterized protein n=1 Tax=Artomyces pyxidatus TaxID=48021 RepID=A0ACB8TD04_9AGAM|nr:hypothetical protein BV25DRAFT_1835936 [Artomyces pyxidatus]